MEEQRRSFKDIEMTSSDISHTISFMERLKRFIDRHGLKGMFTTLLTVFIASVVGYFAYNPGVFFEKIQEYSNAKHEEAIKARMEVDPQIREYLADMKVELDANRTYVLEAHNGGSNLSNLPFLYTDLTYIVPRAPYSELESEYKNFRLSRFPWASHVADNGFWFGPIEDIYETDPELYYKLQKEGVVYMGMILLHGNNTLPIGAMGVVFTDENDVPDPRFVAKTMQKYSSTIAMLLTNNTPKNN